MSFVDTFEKDLDTAVNAATSFGDLLDKVAGIASAASGELPPEVGVVVNAAAPLIKLVDGILHALKSALPAPGETPSPGA